MTFLSRTDGIRFAGAASMGLYRHPHLTRGVMHTPEGAFRINRGIVDLPDELGERLGLTPLTTDGDGAPDLAAVRRATPHEDPDAGDRLSR